MVSPSPNEVKIVYLPDVRWQTSREFLHSGNEYCSKLTLVT
jgi:hypothetical protein